MIELTSVIHIPKFTYGVNFSGSYKGFDVSLLVQGVQGNDIYNGTKVLTQGMARLFNMDKAVLDAWTPTNTNTDIPRAVNGDPNQNTRTSDRFVEDGSYLRVKNLTVRLQFTTKVIIVCIQKWSYRNKCLCYCSESFNIN